MPIPARLFDHNTWRRINLRVHASAGGKRHRVILRAGSIRIQLDRNTALTLANTIVDAMEAADQ